MDKIEKAIRNEIEVIEAFDRKQCAMLACEVQRAAKGLSRKQVRGALQRLAASKTLGVFRLRPESRPYFYFVRGKTPYEKRHELAMKRGKPKVKTRLTHGKLVVRGPVEDLKMIQSVCFSTARQPKITAELWA